MTVEVFEPYIEHTGNGQTTEFRAPPTVLKTDLAVDYIIVDENNEPSSTSRLTIDVHYTVQNENQPGNSQVTIIDTDYIPNFDTDNSKLAIYNEADPVQPISMPNEQLVSLKKVERGLDRLTILLQQYSNEDSRSVKVPVGSSISETAPKYEAGSLWRYDPLSKKISLIDISELALELESEELSVQVTYNVPFDTPISVEINQDGVTSDAKTLQDYMEARPQGGTFIGNKSKEIFLNGRLRVPSRWDVIGCNFVGNADSGVFMAGDYTEVGSLADRVRISASISSDAEWIPLDTSSVGGGPASTYFSVGDAAVIRSSSQDESGNSSNKEFLGLVKEVNDVSNQIRISRPPENSYVVSNTVGSSTYYTTVAKVVSADITSDIVAGQDAVPVNPLKIGNFGEGDFVILEDDSKTGSGLPLNVQPNEVVKTSGNDVYLADPVKSSMTTANSVRLIKCDPCYRSSIQGCSMKYKSSPSTSLKRNAFEGSICSGCFIENCEVVNDGSGGNRGNLFRFHKSYLSYSDNCVGKYPKYLSSGEGYIFGLFYSSRCEHRNISATGGRYGAIFQGSNRCEVNGGSISDIRNAGVDWHGANEVGCYVNGVNFSGGPNRVTSTQTMFKAGNPTHKGPVTNCGAINCTISNAEETGATVFRTNPGVNGFFAHNIKANNIDKFFIHREEASDPTLLTQRVSFSDIGVTNLNSFLDINGGDNNTLQKFAVIGAVIRGLKDYYFSLTNADGIELDNVKIRESLQDSDTFVLTGNGVDNLRIKNQDWDGIEKGVSLLNCPGFEINEIMITDPDFDQVFEDLGGNDNGTFEGVRTRGFTPTFDAPTPSTGIKYDFKIDDFGIRSASSPSNPTIGAGWTRITDLDTADRTPNYISFESSGEFKINCVGRWCFTLFLDITHDINTTADRVTNVRLYDVTGTTAYTSIPVKINRNGDRTPIVIDIEEFIDPEVTGNNFAFEIGNGSTVTVSAVNLLTSKYRM